MGMGNSSTNANKSYSSSQGTKAVIGTRENLGQGRQNLHTQHKQQLIEGKAAKKREKGKGEKEQRGELEMRREREKEVESHHVFLGYEEGPVSYLAVEFVPPYEKCKEENRTWS